LPYIYVSKIDAQSLGEINYFIKSIKKFLSSWSFIIKIIETKIKISGFYGAS